MIKNTYTIFFLISLFFITSSFSAQAQQESKANQGSKPEVKFEPLNSKNDFVFSSEKENDFEVLYFFSYACPHCYQFQSYIELWKERGKQSNVGFSKIPVQFKDSWIEVAKAYEVGRKLEIVDEMTPKLFDYMHEQNKDMFSKEDLRIFFTQEMDVDEDDFNKHYNSFSLKIAMKKYKKYTRQFEIDGTPTLILITRNGSTFKTSPNIAETPMNMITTIDYIVARLNERYEQQ